MPKKSRTGKKKRPLYGPQGKKTAIANVPKLTEEEIRGIKKAKKLNYIAMGFLIVALIIIGVAPSIAKEAFQYKLVVSLGYLCTMSAGVCMLNTANYVVENRVRMTKISGWLMIGFGVLGIVFAFFGERLQG